MVVPYISSYPQDASAGGIGAGLLYLFRLGEGSPGLETGGISLIGAVLWPAELVQERGRLVAFVHLESFLVGGPHCELVAPFVFRVAGVAANPSKLHFVFLA